MTQSAPDPASIRSCTHRTRTGRRCHFPPFSDTPLCVRRTPIRATLPETDLTETFGEEILTDPRSATQINTFLGVLAFLVVENRVSPRRAAVLAYISSLLLRSLPAVQQENPPQFIFGLPRPKPQPEPQPYNYYARHSAESPNIDGHTIDGTPARTSS